jgi:hypothetical protein
MSSIGSLDCVGHPMVVHSVLRASQWEPTCCLPASFMIRNFLKPIFFSFIAYFYTGFFLSLSFKPDLKVEAYTFY